MTRTGSPFVVAQLSEQADLLEQLVADARVGLTAEAKWLPCKYLYDARGSELFEEITRQPEYYPTRAEAEILEGAADDIMEMIRPDELFEIGSGSSTKTRLLLEAMHRHGGDRYVPLDVSRDALEDAARVLIRDYPWLEVAGLVGDFGHHLEGIPRNGRRLVAFLGSTIGNMSRDEHVPFLREVREILAPGDGFLLGVDLVKDPRVIEAAYNDRAGVTARFTRNILNVLNRELDGDLPVEDFEHVARWDPERALMDIRLRARRAVDARLDRAELDVHFDAGEDVSIEISCKFTEAGIRETLAEAGLGTEGWFTDGGRRFGLALALPVAER